ncbi:RRP15-like protein isoform X2 [Anguilla anguilla]|nr:RRP15-like protein isoform X2 [Anguilla anguilla]XP_035288614.1 RRP15-like protein isoform X2 [Anguilla anguilla]
MCVSERRGSVRLSPIHESPYQHHNESVVSTEKQREPPPPLHWKDIASCSDASCSTNRDGTSDMIMPSGVSSFLLDCMDSSSPASPACQSSTDTSLPSPEVFRRADDEEALEFSAEELFTLRVKNSTLLDVSHAVDIDMRQPPNLSSILEVTLDGTAVEKGSPQTRVNMVRAPFKQPRKITRARPLKCRKKVTFHESVLRQELQKEEDRTESYGLKVAKQEVCGSAGAEKGLGVLEMSSDLQLISMEDEDDRSSSMTQESEDDDDVERSSSMTQESEDDDDGERSSSMTQESEDDDDDGERSSSMTQESEDDDDDDDDGERSSSMTQESEDDDDGENFRRGEDARTLSCDVCTGLARFFDFADHEEKEAFLQRKRGKPPAAFPSKPPITSKRPVPDQLGPVYLKFKNSEVHDPNELHEACWIQLVQEGENFFRNSHLKKVASEEGVFYEDYGKVRQFHGQVFFPLLKDASPEY